MKRGVLWVQTYCLMEGLFQLPKARKSEKEGLLSSRKRTKKRESVFKTRNLALADSDVGQGSYVQWAYHRGKEAPPPQAPMMGFHCEAEV